MAKIMVVDDAKFMRTMIREAFRKAGHEVVAEAANGNEAIKQFQIEKPDLITMDITMRERDGLSAAKEILEMDASACIIMVTALGQEAMLSQAVKMGVKDFIVKPFTPDRLIQAAEKALSS